MNLGQLGEIWGRSTKTWGCGGSHMGFKLEGQVLSNWWGDQRKKEGKTSPNIRLHAGGEWLVGGGVFVLNSQIGGEQNRKRYGKQTLKQWGTDTARRGFSNGKG